MVIPVLPDEKDKFFECQLSFLPPSVNKTISTARWAHANKEVERLQNAMTYVFRNEKNKRGLATYEGTVALILTIYTPNHRCFDLDNRIKALQDSLALAGVIKNDNKIYLGHQERIISKGAERCEVALYRHTERTVE